MTQTILSVSCWNATSLIFFFFEITFPIYLTTLGDKIPTLTKNVTFTF